ncbi:hypothetical protein CFII64_18443 [Pseudomonas sp. CFII64]|jgi:hypothetical protein|uniref:hypothetical protein n=1 Tax=Pseudomonas sp. CFII64 TaxID=911242 RepID=UPI0003570581|nr:hypothetical protein [Pseudomonas sp. CFII64]EPJ79862.1 hypothetical protein CFII64_18443 [Pseudomonas sp. CFII64]
MTQPMSFAGIIHTVISLIPVIAGIYSFARYSKIDKKRRSGNVYLVGLVLAVITSFTVSSTGGLNAGHAFGIVVLLAAFGGVLVHRFSVFGKLRPYLSDFGLSFSFFLSLVPAVNETLTRLPASQPLAAGPTASVVKITLLVLFCLFVVGFAAQCRIVYTQNRGLVRT